MANVLIIDDEETICWGLQKACHRASHDAVAASSVEKGLELIDQQAFDVIVTDVRLPGMDGIAAIQEFQTRLPGAPVIVMTAFGDLATAINAIQNGAFEYLVKPFELESMLKLIDQAVATRKLQGTSSNSGRAERPGNLVGSSPVMQEVYRHIALTTTTEAPVLLTGESGTGKELVARSIHDFSPRASGPFVAVNIAALNPSLAESELFGHKKGAFTGADADRRGLIEQAAGGTLFLDEVAEIPLEIQVKLLRVLDVGEVTPVGSNQTIKTDFRLVSATHQDLSSLINDGTFRHDLFYRLRTFEIRLPALRDRLDDLPELVAAFLRATSSAPPSVSEGFVDALRRRPWPGNVRELKSVVERAAVLARGGVLAPEHLTVDSKNENEIAPRDLDARLATLAAAWIEANWGVAPQGGLHEALLQVIEPGVLEKAFELSGRQYSAAARRLGIHRTTLRKKLERPDDSESPD